MENGWCRIDRLATGYQGEGLYQQTQKLPVTLAVHRDAAFADPMVLISTHAKGTELYQLYKRRLQIEHGFRDIKSTFGFGNLVLRKTDKSRMELLFLIAIFADGLCFLGYVKSADRWAKTLNIGKQKTFAIPTILKRVLTQEWNPQKLRRWFAGTVAPGFSPAEALTLKNGG